MPRIARALIGRQYEVFVLVAEDDASGLPVAIRRASSAGLARFGSTH